MRLSAQSRPRLWKFARVQFDEARQRHVLQYPEGAVLLNDTAAEILALCDGTRTLSEIAQVLQARYGSDVQGDVESYLSQLADRELVRDAAAAMEAG